MTRLGPAGAVVVGGVDAHAGARHARFVERHACSDGDVGEGAVLLVLVEAVRLRVVGDEQVEPAVAVVIEERDAERLRGRVVETGFLRRVLELAAAGVAIERRALPLVRLGRAVRLRLAVERAVQVLLDRPVDVVGDEQIEPPVAVVVEPRRARREAGVADAGGVGHVREAHAAEVMEQAVLAERGDVEIGPAVVVVVAGGGAETVERDAQPRCGSDVGERAVAIVPVEREQRLARGTARPRHRVDEQDVLRAVSVGVEERPARAHRFRQVFLAECAAVVAEADPGRFRDVGEGRERGRRHQRRACECRGDDAGCERAGSLSTSGGSLPAEAGSHG